MARVRRVLRETAFRFAPAVLLALWLYATIEGVGSARESGRLVERDPRSGRGQVLAYRWLEDIDRPPDRRRYRHNAKSSAEAEL